MKIRSILLAVIAMSITITGFQDLRADSTNFAIGLSANGILSWTNQSGAVGYKIYWAPSLDGPWTAGWDSAKFITASGSVMQASVPMFYRVALITDTNTLLLHGDGENGSSSIVDVAGHAITHYGSASLSTAQSKFGGASIYFDGAGDYLSLAANSDWAFGTNDFTIDLWVYYPVAPGSAQIIGPHTAYVFSDWCLIHDQGSLKFYLNNLETVAYAWSPTLNTWHHLAVTRADGIVRLFIDGNLINSNLNSANVGIGRTLTIGASENPGFFFTGYMDEIRIKNGKAAWTSNFTPPGSPYVQ